MVHHGPRDERSRYIVGSALHRRRELLNSRRAVGIEAIQGARCAGYLNAVLRAGDSGAGSPRVRSRRPGAACLADLGSIESGIQL